MQLKQLKLVGFKSFAIPTIIPFSSCKIAVVGPNGCGKSNIIDAVRWVLGEASAKNMRGESMSDVIFNGSSERKPLGQASVELVFNNDSGRLGGPHGQYQEVSIRRLVSRNGDSAYFLNGTRCRRKDITDLFLGTGAGARSYSIIGQNTISELIEARPEELRGYLEEAAGISKYKERRRETLASMNQTRDNLMRAYDIQQELDKQLQRLERQASAAKKYILLKQQERQIKESVIVYKWREMQTTLSTQRDQCLHQQQICEQLENTCVEQLQVQSQLETSLANDLLLINKTQSEYYNLNTEVVRLDEEIRQRDREKTQWTEAYSLLEREQAQLKNTLTELVHDEIVLHANNEKAKAQFESASNKAMQLIDAQKVKEQELQAWRALRQKIALSQDKWARAVTEEELKIKHSEAQKNQISLRLVKIEQELELEDLNHHISDLDTIIAEHHTIHQSLQIEQQSYETAKIYVTDMREQLKECERIVFKLQKEVQQATAELASSQATLQVLLRGEYASKLNSDWQKYSRLAEHLQVQAPWRFIVESIMSIFLHAIVLDNPVILPEILSDMERGMSCILPSSTKQSLGKIQRTLPSVIDGLKEGWLPLLNEIKLADTVDEAVAMLPLLESYQSVVTPDGYWLGPGWLRVLAPAEDQTQGIFERKQTIELLEQNLLLLKEKFKNGEGHRETIYEMMEASEMAFNQNQERINALLVKERLLKGQWEQKEKTVSDIQKKSIRLTEEKNELLQTCERLVQEVSLAREHLQEARLALQEIHTQWMELSKTALEEQYSAFQTQIAAAKTSAHQAELDQQKSQTVLQQVQADIRRNQETISNLEERRQTLLKTQTALFNPQEDISATLVHKQEEKQVVESQLNIYQTQLTLGQDKLKLLKATHQQKMIETNEQQSKLMSIKMSIQALEVKCDTLLESSAMTASYLGEQGLFLTEESLDERMQKSLQIEEKIKRLGAINLVAIEEHQETLMRKTTLDTQCGDLKQALLMLEDAIATMDTQTRIQLLQTFEEINSSFQNLFPKLFGGGNAKLTWTSDNILEAGILVMAEPPGKRNSTIHLLSGGEKAMTAIALVFAIFQLNPSPFCFLDEVDAPLDDLNINRFCDLVNQMSSTVQFLMITHNKMTMTLADHLIGVTMREPGVSRIVAVDIEQALSMVE